MTGRRWWLRAAVVVVTWAGCLVAAIRLELDPHPVRLLLVVALVAALAGLLLDCAVDPPPAWHREHPGQADWRGHDQRTGFYLRMLESHLTARSGDPAVRDRLTRLAEETLRTRHGVAPGSAAARKLAVPELGALAKQPPHQMSRDEIDHWIGRIERL